MNKPYTLADGVDEYLTLRGIEKKKYYASYLVAAKYSYKQLFKNTLYGISSQWVPLKKGSPYNYVEKPRDISLFLSASLVDNCGKVVDLFYDNRINVIAKPTTGACKCDVKCDGGICEEVGSMTYTTRFLFALSGVDYYEKKWVKVCPNGEIIEYTITPTKKYNDFIGEVGGDYNDDYSDDYDTSGNPVFANFTIEEVESQKTICKLSVKDCGCPEETTENNNKLVDFCGEYLPVNSCIRNRCKAGEINSKGLGSVKFSECGNRLYYIPLNGENPEFILINGKPKSEKCGEMVEVPDYAILALFKGIDYFSICYNRKYSENEKRSAKYEFAEAENEIISELNPLSLEWLSNLQDAVIKF